MIHLSLVILLMVMMVYGVQAESAKLSPMNSVIEWQNKGDNFYSVGLYDLALHEYEKALELIRSAGLQFSGSFIAIIWNSKGDALNKLGRYREALDAYDTALEIFPSFAVSAKNKEKLLESFPELAHIKSVKDAKSANYSFRLEKCKEIVRNYYDTHIYQIDNYDCDDMTLDLSNQLKKEYINSKIAIGDIDKDITYPWESMHAWVIAEYEPDKWIALEGTGGYIVLAEDNPRYYQGWFFDEPLEFKKYRELRSQLDDEIRYVDQLHREYNSTNMSQNEKYSKAIIIKDHTEKYRDLEFKIIALSQGINWENSDIFNISTRKSTFF